MADVLKTVKSKTLFLYLILHLGGQVKVNKTLIHDASIRYL